MTGRRDPFAALRGQRFDVILADPPWAFKTYKPGSVKAPERHYGTMNLRAIQALPVRDLAAPHCALVMWATAPMLPQAIETMAAWGFRYVTAGAWAKLSRSGEKIAFGTGYVLRSAAEFYLIGALGQPRVECRAVRNLIVAPARQHSRKPDDLHRDLDRLWPAPRRRLELFAREARPGWTVWGNQTARFSGGGQADA